MTVLSLPENFQISSRLSNLNLNEVAEVLNIGEHIYFNGLSLYKNEEQDKHKTMFNNRLEEIRISTDKQIKDHTESVIFQYQKMIDAKDEVILSKSDELFNMKNRITILEQENCQALSLSGKLDSLMGKGNTVDNAMKGDFGESIVANQIQHWYQASEIEDKSADTAKGDLLWKLNDGEFRALVEVKNVQMVRPTEVQKFERDMLINTKDKSCNCGIFVSLKTETIPNKGKFKLEFLNNFPVIYVSNILEDLETLRFALDALCSIQNKYKHIYEDLNDSDDDLNIEDIMVEFVQKQFNKLELMKGNINQMKVSVDILSNCITNEENIIRDLSNNIILLKSDHDIFKQIESEYKINSKEELRESILKDMRLFKEDNGRMPQMSDLSHKYKSNIFRDELAFKKLKKQI